MGLGSIIDRFVSPTNSLGQLGQAMLAASGGPIGGTFQNLIQQRQFMMQHALQQQYQQSRIDLDERRARAPISHVVGADVINEDPMTGAEIGRIHGSLAPTELERDMIGAGIDPHSPQGQSLYRQAAENRADPLQGVPITNPDGSHGITFYRRGDVAGMASGASGAPAPPQPGEVRGSFRFRGGDPASPTSWEPTGQAASPPPGGPPRATATGFGVPQMMQESGGQQFGSNGQTLVGRYRDGSMPDPAHRAYGVGQMQIGTAEATAQRLGVPFDQNRFMNDRDYNMTLANGHMAYLRQRYGGDEALALAAYHSGEGNVDRALRTYGRQNFTRGLGPEGRAYVATLSGGGR